MHWKESRSHYRLRRAVRICRSVDGAKQERREKTRGIKHLKVIPCINVQVSLPLNATNI